jgi:hypothetical protein
LREDSRCGFGVGGACAVAESPHIGVLGVPEGAFVDIEVAGGVAQS